MLEGRDIVAIFNNIHRVMKAEKVLKEHRLDILLIPVPRSLQSDCGLAICFADSEWGAIQEVLTAADLLPEQLFRKVGEEYHRIRGGAGVFGQE